MIGISDLMRWLEDDSRCAEDLLDASPHDIAHLAREIARHCEAGSYIARSLAGKLQEWADAQEPAAIRIEKAGAREQTRQHTLTLSQPGPDGRRILAIKNDSSGHTDKYYLSQENVTQLTGIISD